MADFNIRSDSVDVEQIMKQIRSRIQEKRGVDYTEDQIREIAAVRLEKFLDPKNLRSDLLEQFKRSRPGLPELPKEPPPVEAPYVFDDETLVRSHRAPLRLLRRLLAPILKLFFNSNTLNQILHTQAQFNVDLLKRDQRRKIEMQIFDRSRAEWNVLYYEVLHNLVLETTRNGIELKNLKMRVEALASRLDFSERRVRALEGVVQYRPEVVRPRPAGPREGQPQGGRGPQPAGRPRLDGDSTGEGADAGEPVAPDTALAAGPPAAPGMESPGRRRRRRRRGRRGGGVLPGAGPAAAVEPMTDGGGDDDFDADESDASEELAAIAADEAAAVEDADDSAFDEQPGDNGLAASDSQDDDPFADDSEPRRAADVVSDTLPIKPVDPEQQ